MRLIRFRRLASLLAAIAVAAPTTPLASAAATAPGQTFATPRGQIENVRYEQTADGQISVFYDLLADDAGARFEVLVSVSRDQGRTFDITPKSLTGEVGSNVSPGIGRRFTWDARKDGYPSIQIDQFRFRLNTRAGRAVAAVLWGGLKLASAPAGAAVLLDGKAVGRTPLTLTEVAPGDHSVTFQADGYDPQSKSVTVKAGETASVDATLSPTPAPTPAPSPEGPKSTTGGAQGVEEKGKSPVLWIVLGGAAAAAAVVAAAGGGGGDPEPTPTPTPQPQIPTCTFTVSTATAPANSEAGTGTISVSVSPANCSPQTWTATVDAAATWLRITSGASGNGNGTVNYSFDANQGTTARSGTITVAGQNVTVQQSGRQAVTCNTTFQLRQGGQSDDVGSGGGDRDIQIRANPTTCGWELQADAAFITLTGGRSTLTGAGNVDTVFTFARNTTGQTRTGTVSVYADASPGSGRRFIGRFTFTQRGS